jgi:hypothetical protein
VINEKNKMKPKTIMRIIQTNRYFDRTAKIGFFMV